MGGSVYPVSDAVCPVPTINPTVLYQYNWNTGMCERPVQNACPVTDLPKPPPFTGDDCSQALEDHGGKLPNPAVCQNFDVAKNNLVAKCVASKLAPATLPITATYRTDPYQKHLWELWTRAEQLRKLSYLALVNRPCVNSPVNTAVQAELQHHGNLITPIKTAGSHGESRAIDIPKDVVKALQKKAATFSVTTYTVVKGKKIPVIVPMSIEDYINSTTDNPTPECKAALAYCSAFPLKATPCIQWGGNFKKNPDLVHFQFQ